MVDIFPDILINHGSYQDGRWQEDGLWWLPREAGRQGLLESGAFTTKLDRWAMLRLEQLWERLPWDKTLLPDQATKPRLVQRKGAGNRPKVWWSNLGCIALIVWFRMPKGHYGDPQDPCLDYEAAAAYCGCHFTTIYNWEKQKRIVAESHLSRSGDGFIPTYRRSLLRPLKEEREADLGNGAYASCDGVGVRFSIARAAQELGVTEPVLRRLIRNETFLPAEQLDLDEVRPRHDSKDQVTLTEEAVAKLRRVIAQRRKIGKPKGYESHKGLVALFGLGTERENAELGECLRGWRKAGLIDFQHEPVEIQTTTGRQWNKLFLYSVARARELWEDNYLAKGVKLLKELLANGPRPTPEVKKAMAELGICSRGRWGQVKKRAGARLLRAKGAAEEGNRYELKHASQAETPAEVLRSLFVEGAAVATAAYQRARDLGLSHAEIRNAQRELGVTFERGPRNAKGWGFGPWVWRLPQSEQERHAARTTVVETPTGVDTPAEPTRKRPGRPKGAIDLEVKEKRERMLEEWDQGHFASKAAAGAAYGFHRTDASKIINAHEKASRH